MPGISAGSPGADFSALNPQLPTDLKVASSWQCCRDTTKKHGIEPAPDRKRQTTWQTFLQAHWYVLAAIDFTTVEVWTKNGLVTIYLLFVMELASRRVH